MGSATAGSTAGAPAAAFVSVCPVPGQLTCGGVCTDSRNDPRNCGGCGWDCGAGACANGVCVCPSNMLACAGGCKDTASDPTNCGTCGVSCGAAERCELGACVPLAPACNPACSAGQQCIAGVCQCPAGQMFCGGVCLDPMTTPQHCGTCETMCAPGQLCQAGKCICGAGQMDCGAGCVDLLTSSKDCGMCGSACAEGETCMAGKCRAPIGADGCGGGARDASISEIAAYQSIKVPLNKAMTPIAAADRVAAVIQGRKTLFRVSVNVGPGFAARELSARVHVSQGMGMPMQFFAKQRISKTSVDSDTASTFQVAVPAEQIGPDTRYSVELVECAEASSGMMLQPRFPTMGDQPLEARKTGVLKIKLIPLRANSRVPDTSETALKVYREYMEAMYPIEKVEFTVGEPQNIAYPVDWNGTIDQIRSLRQQQRPDDEIYYYGMLAPTETLKQYCQRGCTAGVGYVGDLRQAQTRVAMGLAFADEMSGGVMAHEVGHNHGRSHAPCAPGNQISGVDRAYPYMGALTKVWGFDSRKQTFFDPATTKDIMGYCEPKWISDYTYKGLVERVASLSTSPLVLSSESTAQQFNVLLVDANGPRWGRPFAQPSDAFGQPEEAEALDIDGRVVERIIVYRTVLGDHDGATLLVPPAKRGWNAVRTADGASLSFAAPISIPAM
ncbi:MAG TPA: M66 family metalloprotease [Polyangiales bacterium]|nr:M66 family metalloprotease [Polyangiales bacterium]